MPELSISHKLEEHEVKLPKKNGDGTNSFDWTHNEIYKLGKREDASKSPTGDVDKPGSFRHERQDSGYLSLNKNISTDMKSEVDSSRGETDSPFSWRSDELILNIKAQRIFQEPWLPKRGSLVDAHKEETTKSFEQCIKDFEVYKNGFKNASSRLDKRFEPMVSQCSELLETLGKSLKKCQREFTNSMNRVLGSNPFIKPIMQSGAHSALEKLRSEIVQSMENIQNPMKQLEQELRTSGKCSSSSSEFYSDAHKEYIIQKAVLFKKYSIARTLPKDRYMIKIKSKFGNSSKPRLTIEEQQKLLKQYEAAYKRLKKLQEQWTEDLDKRVKLLIEESQSLVDRSLEEQDPYKYAGLYNDYNPEKRAKHIANMDPHFLQDIDDHIQNLKVLTSEQNILLQEQVECAEAIRKITMKQLKIPLNTIPKMR